MNDRGRVDYGRRGVIDRFRGKSDDARKVAR
jgi:hypothetical protein